MVSNEVVMNTVKRMLSSGVDDNTIRVTLQGINLDEGEIEKVINEAKGISPEAHPDSNQGISPEAPDDPKEAFEKLKKSKEIGTRPESENEEQDDYAVPDEEEVEAPPLNVKKEIDAVSQEQAAQHTTTHQLLDEHKEKMEAVEKNVIDLHKKIDSTPSLSPETIAKIDSLDTRMSSLEKEIRETKANTKALQELLKKILETNKKTLLKLEK